MHNVQGWNIGQMSDQNIVDEFERMLENMNLTEEKKVSFATFLDTCENVFRDVEMLFTTCFGFSLTI